MKTEKAQSNAERQKAYQARRRAEGKKRVVYWLNADEKAAVDELLKPLK